MRKPTGSVAVLVGMLLCASVTGCAGNRERLQAFLMKPRAPVAAKEYRVLPPDVIQITSLHVPDINNQRQMIRPDGKINLPLLGEIYVAERTSKEIEEDLKSAAKDFYEQVDATVQIVDYRSQRIYVFGQVSRPGPIPFTGCDTLIDVLAQVQPTPMAWMERIHLVRGKPPMRGGYMFDSKKDKKDKKGEKAAAPAESTEPTEAAVKSALDRPDTKARTMIVDMMMMVHDGSLAQNVLLQPNDVIYVPPNPLAAVGLALQQLLMPIRPAAETVAVPASTARMATMP